MEQLDQLKVMRDEARKRIAATADYKLATSLDALIADLESMLGIPSEDDDGEKPDESGDDEPVRAYERSDSDVNPVAAAFADFQTSEEDVAEAAADIEAASEEDDQGEKADADEPDEGLIDDPKAGLNGSGHGHEELQSADDADAEAETVEEESAEETGASIGVEDDFQQALEDLARSTATAPYASKAEEESLEDNADDESSDDDALSEDEAIVRAMQALDEDLANVNLDDAAEDSDGKAG